MPIIQSNHTFTREDIQRILHDCNKMPSKPEIEDKELGIRSCYSEQFSHSKSSNGKRHRYSADERKQVLIEYALRLIRTCINSANHFERLDREVSELFFFRLSGKEYGVTHIDRTSHLLARLSQAPPDLYFEGHVSSWRPLTTSHQGYLTPNPDLSKNWPTNHVLHGTPVLENLQVVSKVSTFNIRQALQLTTEDRSNFFPGIIKQSLDVLSELLDVIHEVSVENTNTSLESIFIVNTFLWTCWYRGTMIFFHYLLERQLEGYTPKWNEFLSIRGINRIQKTSVYGNLATPKLYPDVSSYMCGWAFELLATHKAAIAQDFRLLHKRFSDAHKDHSARCIWQSKNPCPGYSPESCQRFVDLAVDRPMVMLEQSVHDMGCFGVSNCHRIEWAPSSYDSIVGSRAVVPNENSTRITYCAASTLTLAISHVWSHGQGGRPSTGIDQCLHRRYCKLSQEHGCDSYWIDTLCIPEDYGLRKEAIRGINSTFRNSRITLICDRDLMAIDIEDFTVQRVEELLATLLVCDWNVRAWTLLEAIKGNKGLHILCKDNEIVSLRRIFDILCNKGNIEIAILALTCEYLLPSGPEARTTEVAANLLTHRYASRKGDDFVIWSLLSSENGFETAEEMWNSKILGSVKTGYLVSTAARLNVPGFRWAPTSPNPYPPKGAETGIPLVYLSWDGEGSEECTILSEGLAGPWLIHDVTVEEIRSYQGSPWTAKLSYNKETESWDTMPLPKQFANACIIRATELLLEYKWVALLQPLMRLHKDPYETARRRGEMHGIPLAVVASHNRKTWEWKDVREWQHLDPFPVFKEEYLLIS